MQRIAKELRSAYNSKKQLEDKLVSAGLQELMGEVSDFDSKISGLEEEIRQLRESGVEKGIKTRERNLKTLNNKRARLYTQIDKRDQEIREAAQEQPEIETLNSKISLLESHLADTNNPIYASQGKRFVYTSPFSESELNSQYADRNSAIRNAFVGLRAAAAAGDETAFNDAADQLRSAARSGDWNTWESIANRLVVGAAKFDVSAVRPDPAAKFESIIGKQYEELLLAQSGFKGAVERRVIDSEARAVAYADNAAVRAERYADGGDRAVAQHAEGELRAAEERNNAQHGTLRRWIYGAFAATAVAGAIGIAALLYNPKGEEPDLSNYATTEQVETVDKKADDNEGKITTLENNYGSQQDEINSLKDDVDSLKDASGGYVTEDELDERLEGLEATATPTPSPTEAPVDLSRLMNANAFGLPYGLARDMYNSDPAGFNAAFGIVPQAAPQVPRWFDGNPSNAEATSINGAVLRVSSGATTIHLLENGRGAEFASELGEAKEFVANYLRENTDRLADIVYE